MTRVRLGSRCLRAALCLGIPAMASSVAAAPEAIDRIAVIVDDDVVLESELTERFVPVVRRMEADGQGDVPREMIWDQILEALIRERIQLREALRRNIEVDDETLTVAVGNFARQNEMTVEEFIAELQAQGESYRGIREQIRRDLTIERVQRNAVNRRVYITDQDVDELMGSPFFREMISDEYRLGHILVQVEPGATNDEIGALRAKAEEVVAKLREGGDFSALAVQHSSAPTAAQGGDLGWRKSGRIPSVFADVAVALEISEVAEPLRDASGFHIVKLIDRRGASQERAEQTLVRHILLVPSTIRSDDETRAAIEDLRARVLAGEDFAELAKEHSEDPGTALAGGDLGWSTPEGLDPIFQAAMNATAVDELSKPVRSQFGWHVLEVQGRRQQDVSEEARRNYASRILFQRRFEERLQEWLREIRDEAFVEQRISYADFAGKL